MRKAGAAGDVQDTNVLEEVSSGQEAGHVTVQEQPKHLLLMVALLDSAQAVLISAAKKAEESYFHEAWYVKHNCRGQCGCIGTCNGARGFS